MGMTPHPTLSRRGFLAAAAAAPLALAAPAEKIPIGIELYSVRDEMTKDTPATVRAIAKMGYEVAEFYGPYYSWTPEMLKDVRKALDDTGLRCLSTHNDARNFRPGNIQKAIDYNKTLGSRYVVMASTPRVENLDGWKAVGDTLIAGDGETAPRRIARRLSQPPTGVQAPGRQASHRSHCRQHPQGRDAATGCRHLRGSGPGPGRVDRSQSGPHQFPAT